MDIVTESLHNELLAATVQEKKPTKKNHVNKKQGKVQKKVAKTDPKIEEVGQAENDPYGYGEMGEEEEEEEKFMMPDECLENQSRTKVLPEHYQSSLGGPMNTEWFAKLRMSKTLQKAMCYSESLLMVTESGDTVGKMYCTVSESEWNETSCLSVHSGSTAAFQDGLECGTTVTGFVNSRFRILHEYIHEWAKLGNKMFERKTFLIQEKDTMNCRVIVIRNKKVTEDRVFFLSKLECQNLITESGNILFQRVIIQEKKTGEIIVRTVTSKGSVVRCTYNYLGHGTELVKGENVKVFGIRRTVFEEDGAKVWDSLFNYFGRLVLRCQPENENALVPFWFEAVKTTEILDSTYGSRPPLLWACDMELYDKYITEKREKAGEYRTYLKDHPELRALLSDFLQAVLQQKPSNIIGFASNYFEPWLPYHDDSSSVLELSNEGTLSSELAGGEDTLGEDLSEESGTYKGMYPNSPLMEEDNVLLEENSEYYLKDKFQNQNPTFYGQGLDPKEVTTVYKNNAAFQ